MLRKGSFRKGGGKPDSRRDQGAKLPTGSPSLCLFQRAAILIFVLFLALPVGLFYSAYKKKIFGVGILIILLFVVPASLLLLAHRKKNAESQAFSNSQRQELASDSRRYFYAAIAIGFVLAFTCHVFILKSGCGGGHRLVSIVLLIISLLLSAYLIYSAIPANEASRPRKSMHLPTSPMSMLNHVLPTIQPSRRNYFSPRKKLIGSDGFEYQRTDVTQPIDEYHWPKHRRKNIWRLGHFMAQKEERVRVAHETLNYLRRNSWPWSKSSGIRHIRYDVTDDMSLPKLENFTTKISISSEDSLEAALRLLRHSTREVDPKDVPAVLNMANQYHSGGGFLFGARAQEEDLCRRSDLYMALQSAKYPLEEFSCIHTFPVHILRQSKKTDYKFLQEEDRGTIAVLTAAAYDNPRQNATWNRNMRRKIDSVLLAALGGGHRNIILAAWGCGAFKNDPEHVAEMFHDALCGPKAKFRCKFKHVVFAMSTVNDEDANAGFFLRAFDKSGLYHPTTPF